MVPPQVVPLSGESVPVTEPVPSQLSVQVRSVIAGTALMHETVIAAGAGANVGAILSLIEITCWQVATTQQSLAMLYVRVII